jgi:hypothetical protein
VVIEISNNHLDFSSSSIRYDFMDPVVLILLHPPNGPKAGDTLLNILGLNFYTPNRDIWCRFGDKVNQSGTFVTSTHITCLSPPFFGLPNVRVQVTVNNADFSESAKSFRYAEAPEIAFASPSVVIHLGGTRITLVGANFENSEGLRCKFVDRTDLNFKMPDMLTFEHDSSFRLLQASQLAVAGVAGAFQLAPARWLSESKVA